MAETKKSYGQIYDQKCIIYALCKMFVLLLVVFVISLSFFSTRYVGISILLAAAYIGYHYFGSVRKIILEEDRIVLQKFPDPISLSYDIISSANMLEYRDIKLLKKKVPSFTFFGKRGWYRSKRLEDLFIYSCSDKYKDNVLLEYGADYYMFSVQDRDRFLVEIKEKISDV